MIGLAALAVTLFAVPDAATQPKGLPNPGRVELPPPPKPTRVNRLNQSRLLEVGPDRLFKTPGDVAPHVRDGDTVAIDAGTYVGDVAVWRANNLTLRGVGGLARLDAAGRSAQGKAIWVIAGANTTVENIAFLNAEVRDRNGAGIRQEGPDLTVRNCLFRNNQNGILTGTNRASDILIEFSEFEGRKEGVGHSHNIYIGEVASFTLRGSYSHRAREGHAVKSRARRNVIVYNRLADGLDGRSSYLLDLPNGGTAFIIGNEFQQGPRAVNQTAISFSAEHDRYTEKALFIVNNTLINQRRNGYFLQNRSSAPDYVANNLFLGDWRDAPESDRARGNVRMAIPATGGFVPPNGGVAIDAGIDPGHGGGRSLRPRMEYRHPLAVAPRPRTGRLDAGAHEIGGS